jgi:hypothetical protein
VGWRPTVSAKACTGEKDGSRAGQDFGIVARVVVIGDKVSACSVANVRKAEELARGGAGGGERGARWKSEFGE